MYGRTFLLSEKSGAWLVLGIFLAAVGYVLVDLLLCAPGQGAAREASGRRLVFWALHSLPIIAALLFAFLVHRTSLTAAKQHRELQRLLWIDEIMLDSLPVHIWFLNDPCTYGGANKTHADFLGMQREIIPGIKLGDVLPAGVATVCEQGNAEVFTSRRPVNSIERGQDCHGHEHVLDVLKVPRFDSQGKVTQVVCVGTDITHTYELEEENRKVQERLAMLMDVIPDLVNFKDAEGRWQLANQAMVQAFDLEGAEWLGKTDRELADAVPSNLQDALQVCAESDEEAWRNGKVSNFTEIISADAGMELYYAVTKKPLFYENGARKGLLVTARDITPLMLIKKYLEQERDKLKAILMALPDIIFIHDADLRIQECYANQNEDLYTAREAILGKRVEDILPHHLGYRLSRVVQQVANSREPETLEYELDLEGHWKSYEARIVPYSTDGVLSVIHEITTIKQTLRELRILKAAVEKSPASFVITDAQTRILYVNDAFCETTGYASDDVHGKHVSILKSGHHSREFYKAMWAVLNDGRTWRGEFKNRKRNGETYWEDAIITPVVDELGTTYAYAAIKYDITEKKNQEFELVRQREVAEESCKVKSEFLAMMSHELRTPLHVMLGMLQLAKDDHEQKRHEHYIEIAEQAAATLSKALSDILEFVSTGHEDVKKEPFSIETLLEDVIGGFIVQAKEKKLELLCERCIKQDVKILSDEYRIRQVFYSLVSNAIKFTDSGSVRVTCEMGASPNDTQGLLVVAVQDTGIGIPDYALGSVFEPFRQGDQSLTRRHGGMGIGLALANKLVEQMGGRLEVSSTPYEGSTFTLTLPVELEAEATRKVPSDQATKLPENVKILYVEDSKTNQLVIERLFAKQDVAIDCADNGLLGVQAARETAYDVVIMDINMPVMDGIEAMQTIRAAPDYATPADVPIIALTGYGDAHEKERFQALGFTDFFSKPPDFNNLLACVHNFIENKNNGEDT